MMLTIQLSCLSLLTICSAHWCYNSQFTCDGKCQGPIHWFSTYPFCGGHHQSPINIVTHKAQHDSTLNTFYFEGYTHPLNVTVENTGQSAHFALPASVRMSGGGLTGWYKAVQFHFHWGVDAAPGSEHTVDGERYPMELHIVNIREQYSNLQEARNHTAGIALLSFLFKESSVENVPLNTVIEAMGRVRYAGNSSSIPAFRLRDIVPSAHELSNYYRYTGSMTTPGCEETVIWTLFQRTLPISQTQLVAIGQQMLFWTGTPMIGNFRPVQNLNGRAIYKSAATSVLSAPVVLWFFALTMFVSYWTD